MVVRATKSFYWLGGGMLGLVLAVDVMGAIMKDSSLWLPSGFMAVLLAWVLSWLVSTKLTLTNDSIHYRSLFVKVDIPLSDVIRADFVIGFGGYKPYQRIVVERHIGSQTKEVIINAGLLDRGQVRRWMSILKSKLA